jgi:asparaginyl-tRNA synthetase
MLLVRRSACRPYLLRHAWGTAAASAQASSPCRPRYSSTFYPSSIAELLSLSSAQSSSPQSTPVDGRALKINGYVRTVRKQKRIAFAAIGDGSTLQTVQAVLSPQLAEGLVGHSSTVLHSADVLNDQALDRRCGNSYWEMDPITRPRSVI